MEPLLYASSYGDYSHMHRSMVSAVYNKVHIIAMSRSTYNTSESSKCAICGTHPMWVQVEDVSCVDVLSGTIKHFKDMLHGTND